MRVRSLRISASDGTLSRMSTLVIEPQFASVIREIQTRKAKNPPVPKQAWMKSFGSEPENATTREAERLGKEWRDQEGQTE